MDDPHDVLGVGANATQSDINRARARLQRSLGELQSSISPEQFTRQAAAIDIAWRALQHRDTSDLDHALASSGAKQSTSQHGGQVCTHCGGAPAINVVFRQRVRRHQVVSTAGYYCRSCGIATFRNTTNGTLLQGFWRLLSLVSTIAIVRGNIVQRRRITRLSPTSDPTSARVGGTEEIPERLNPGQPLLLRSGILAIGATVLLFAGTITSLTDVFSIPNCSRNRVSAVVVSTLDVACGSNDQPETERRVSSTAR